MNKLCTADEAVNHVNSNQRVFLHGGAATPLALVEALVGEAPRLRNVELIHLHTSGEAAYANAEYAKSFRVANLFVGHNMRRQPRRRPRRLPAVFSLRDSSALPVWATRD